MAGEPATRIPVAVPMAITATLLGAAWWIERGTSKIERGNKARRHHREFLRGMNERGGGDTSMVPLPQR